MKYIWCSSILLTFFIVSVFSQSENGLPPGPQILDEMREQLPGEPIVIQGELEVRKRKGIVTRTLNVEMLLNLGRRPATAKYILRDAFGKDLEQMTVTRNAGSPAQFSYAAGNPMVSGNLPDLFKPFLDTDVSWMDLTLSFLWWPGGKTIRTETLRGQNCFVVDISAPPGESGQYKKVLLWIDEKLRMVLQADGYDAKGELVRRLFIKSFKKINERWMIKDMDIQSFPSDHRTNLRVETMRIDKS
ncbi:MAG: outer membrane lipoprotein-sorting protein [Kiritimatiellae bacterium]|nr:outer membrane lipoprotein-sorting protein [Kiritimatiellia bacterium]